MKCLNINDLKSGTMWRIFNGRTDRLTDEWMDGWMNGWMNRLMDNLETVKMEGYNNIFLTLCFNPKYNS